MASDTRSEMLLKLLARLLIEELEKKGGYLLIKAHDAILLDGMSQYFRDHKKEDIEQEVYDKIPRTLTGIIKRGTEIDQDTWELMEHACDYHNKHVRDIQASEEHWLGKCY